MLQLNLLSALRHENLVPLFGYCCENDQQILVYPFMSNGSLQDRLYGTFSLKITLLREFLLTVISYRLLVSEQEKQQREKLLTGQPDFLLLWVLLEASDIGVFRIFYFIAS